MGEVIPMSPRKRRDSKLARRFMFHLRRLREKAGLTQEELAEAVGIPNKNVISMLENGHRGASDDTVERFADFFGVDVGDFYSPTSKAISRTSSVQS